MSFENGELDFKFFKQTPKPEYESDDGSDKPVDPILEDEREAAAKKQADDLLEQKEINNELKAIGRRKAAKEARKKKAWKELNSEKDYLGPQRYDQAAWDKHYQKKKKI